MGSFKDTLFKLKFHILSLILLFYITYKIYYFYTGDEFKYLLFKRNL